MLVCKICGSSRLTELGEIEGLKYIRCNNCEFVFDPTKVHYDDNLSEFYGDNFSLAKDAQTKEIMYDFELDRIQKYKPGGNLLDFGGGIGGFAVRAGFRGFNSYVVEPNRLALEIAKKNLGDSKAYEHVSKIDADITFDVVIMNHVAEHLADPVSDLRAVYERMSHNGLLVVAVPNADFYGTMAEKFIRKRGIRNLKIMGGGHISCFNKKSLCKALERASFREMNFLTPIYGKFLLRKWPKIGNFLKMFASVLYGLGFKSVITVYCYKSGKGTV